MTAPARFTQADIRRAAAGVTAAGLGIAKIEIDLSGKIVATRHSPSPYGSRPFGRVSTIAGSRDG